MNDLPINEDLVIPAEDIVWTFSRSSGPGGQNVNKVNSKATLKWQPPDNFLPWSAWQRFLKKAQRFLTAEGSVVIQCQEHRDRLRNMESCRNKLQQLIASSLVVPKKRISTKPSKASKQRRLDAKRFNSQKKQSRSWNE